MKIVVRIRKTETMENAYEFRPIAVVMMKR